MHACKSDYEMNLESFQVKIEAYNSLRKIIFKLIAGNITLFMKKSIKVIDGYNNREKKLEKTWLLKNVEKINNGIRIKRVNIVRKLFDETRIV